jgi:hypothetical protein
VVSAGSVELLVTGENDELLSLPFERGTCMIFNGRLSSHTCKTAVGVGLDVCVVWVPILSDIRHHVASGSNAVHSLFPLLDCTVFETDGIPLASNIDVCSCGDRRWIQWWNIVVRTCETTIGVICSFDVKAVHACCVGAVSGVCALH